MTAYPEVKLLFGIIAPNVTNCNNISQNPKVLKKYAVIHIVRDKKSKHKGVWLLIKRYMYYGTR